MRFIRSLTALALFAAATGCVLEDDCPSIYVPDTLRIVFDDAPRADETWVLEVAVDGMLVCSLTFTDVLPGILGRCGTGGASEVGGEPLRVMIPDFTPDQVELTLSIDDQPAGEVQAAPIYRTVEHDALCSMIEEAVVDFEVQRPL